MKYLILNTSIPEINVNGHQSYMLVNKYPGARWIYYVSVKAKNLGFKIIDPHSAITMLKEGQLKPDYCILLNEGLNREWLELAALGIEETILYNFESPLYQPFFYDWLEQKKLPKFIGEHIGFPYKPWLPNDPLFPAYEVFDIPGYNDEGKIDPQPPKLDRCVAVISNKNWVSNPNAKEIIRTSRNYKKALFNELHTTRAHDLIDMIKNDYVDIFGQGWEHPNPFNIQELYDKPIVPVTNKLETIAKYQYCYAMENVNQRGYVTEKAIEAIVAGCVPYTHNDVIEFLSERGIRNQRDLLADEFNIFSHKHMTNRVMEIIDSVK